MKKDRRLFINQISIMAGLAALSKPIAAVASISKPVNTIHSNGHNVTIYHSNDLHGNLGFATGNAGGLNQLQALLKKQETNGLLLDAGGFLDLSEGFSGQKMMIRAMNETGYHAAAIGNDELAMGQGHLASLVPLMRFDLLNCNYVFEGALDKLVKPFIIINSGRFKIGVTAIGHKLQGIRYNDAIQSANAIARHLKETEKCDLVICLSHLGYRQPGHRPDDRKLAKASEHIDMIISGHNRFVLSGPIILHNKLKQEIIIGQAGYNGLMMGKIVFNFEKGSNKYNFKGKNIMAGGRPGGTFAGYSAETPGKSNQVLTETQPV